MTTRLAAGSDSTIWVGATEPTLALHHRRPAAESAGRERGAPPVRQSGSMRSCRSTSRRSRSGRRLPTDGVEIHTGPNPPALAGTPRRDSLSGRPGDRIVGGLRPSEYLAMPWRHLSIDSREVRVVQAVHRVRNDRVTRWENVEIAGYRFGPTKTHRSMRPVG